MSENVLEPSVARNLSAPLSVGLPRRLHQIALNRTLLGGLILLAIVVFVAIAAPLLTPYDPIAQNLGEAFRPPLSPDHVLGTDNFGRDMWSRIAYSTRL